MGGSKQQSSSGPPGWMQRDIQQYIDRANTLSQTPYEAYTGDRVAGLSDETQAGMGELQKTAEGGYINSNPYLDETFDRASRKVADAYKYGTAPQTAAAASRAGAMGGSAYGELQDMQRYNLGENLGNLATDIYGGDYTAERNRQQQAARDSAMMGESIVRGQQQQEQDWLYQLFRDEIEHPYKQADVMGNALAIGMGGAGTQSTVKSGK